MRLWRRTRQDKLDLSIWKNFRRAFVYTKELLGCLSTPACARATTGAGFLWLLRVGSQSPQPGLQAGESAASGVLGTSEHRLSCAWCPARGGYRMVLDRSAPRIRQASQESVEVLVDGTAAPGEKGHRSAPRRGQDPVRSPEAARYASHDRTRDRGRRGIQSDGLWQAIRVQRRVDWFRAATSCDMEA